MSNLEHIDRKIDQKIDDALKRVGTVHPRSFAFTYLLLLVSGVLLALGVATIAWAAWIFVSGSSGTEGPAMCFLGLGYKLLRKGRARLARQRALSIDAEMPTVLYLRSFLDDITARRGVQGFGALTEEEHLVQALSAIGPVQAVGMPDEVLPQLGALRLVLPSGAWQGTVARWISQAELVVLRIGETPGFWWEVEEVLRRRPAVAALFIVPHGRLRYDAFASRLKTLRPELMVPEYRTHATEAKLSICSFLAFGPARQLAWHSIPRRSVPIQLFQPLSVPLARVIGRALGRELHPRTSWTTHFLAGTWGLLVIGYWSFMASIPIGIAIFFVWLYVQTTRYPPPLWEHLLIAFITFVVVLACLGFGLGLAWFVLTAFGLGPVWPARPRPDERWYRYLRRLWKLSRMRNPPADLREHLVADALEHVVTPERTDVHTADLERVYHAASGLIGADHPDLVPVLLRLSLAYGRDLETRESILAQAAAVHLGRRFFGPGHPEHLRTMQRLKLLLARHPGPLGAELKHLVQTEGPA